MATVEKVEADTTTGHMSNVIYQNKTLKAMPWHEISLFKKK